MKVLVTGGTGFLGTHIRQVYPKKTRSQDGVRMWFSGSELELTNSHYELEYYANQVWGSPPDVILHLAAICGGIIANHKYPADFLTQNLQMGINIFEYARLFGVKLVYTLGSICEYPKFCPTPFQEDDLWNGYPEETNAPYGIAKRVLMELGKSYRKQYGIGGAHLIPVNLFGPHDHFNTEDNHVIPALIERCIKARNSNAPYIECIGTGEASREFVYAADVAQYLVEAILKDLDTDLPINIGVGKSIKIKDLVKLVAELTGYQGDIRFNGTISDGQPQRQLNVNRLHAMLGVKETTSLKEGLKKTIVWYEENYDNFNKMA